MVLVVGVDERTWWPDLMGRNSGWIWYIWLLAVIFSFSGGDFSYSSGDFWFDGGDLCLTMMIFWWSPEVVAAGNGGCRRWWWWGFV